VNFNHHVKQVPYNSDGCRNNPDENKSKGCDEKKIPYQYNDRYKLLFYVKSLLPYFHLLLEIH